MSHSPAIRRLGTPAESSPFETFDGEFAAVLGDAPRLVRVAETDAHEGPVYVAEEDALYFTTLPRPEAEGPETSIGRLALDGLRFPLEPERVSIVRAWANMANGMTLDGEGHLVVCEQGRPGSLARISRIDRSSGAAETLVDAFDGQPLNSPNDVVVRRDGTVWFTDPSYGYLQGFKPEPRLADRVYRHDPRTGRTSAFASSFDKPNGIAFSPDEHVLYVGDNGAPHHLLAFDVEGGRELTNRRRLAISTPEHPDGLKTDSAGRIYASYSGGVHVLAPSGERIGEIKLPGAVNFTFGGTKRNVLFITADTAVWAAVLDTTGPEPLTSKPERKLKGA